MVQVYATICVSLEEWFGVVSGEVRVVEELPAGEAAFGVKHDHLSQEVKLDLVHELQGFLPVSHAVIALQFLQACQNKVTLDAVLLDPHNINDSLKLVDLALALEEDEASDHEVENATQGPYINLCSVHPRAHQQLWSAVKQRAHHIGHGLLIVLKLFGHAQIDDFDVVVVSIDVCRLRLRQIVRIFGSEHDVGRFEIAMYEVAAVKFLHAFQYLVENLLNGELFLTGNDPIEVGSEPLHHHHGLLLAHKRLQHSYQVLP